MNLTRRTLCMHEYGSFFAHQNCTMNLTSQNYNAPKLYYESN
jgi:hypothetical protein